MKRLKIVSVLLVLALVITGCGTGGDTETGGMTPGEYEVKVDGYAGEMTVVTTLTSDSIEKIEITEHDETEMIGTNAIDELPGAIVENQSVAVDVVSGATVTSDAIIDGVKKAIEEAGGDVKDFSVEVSKDSDSESYIVDTDVVVVGGGGAGLSAAIEAATNGADVILIEKMPALGGNTIRAGGPYNAADPERQKNNPPADETAMDNIRSLTEEDPKSERHGELQAQLAEELDEYNEGPKDHLFDSPTLHKLQTYDGGDYVGQLEFIEVLADKALETTVWMEENGVAWNDEITTVAGGLWPRAHMPENAAGSAYIAAGENTAKDLGVEILLNAEAKELIIEDGVVKGITGTYNGEDMVINADATIIATGGFAANAEMRQEYDSSLIDDLPNTNSPGSTGDGIIMSEAVGANVVGMEYIQSLPLGNPEDGALSGWLGGSGVENYYQINKDGVRFMAEDGRRDEMTAALLDQEDAFSYAISCGINESELETTIWGDDVDKLVEDGVIFRADTIEELAEQIDIDPEVLRETNDKYNSYVAQGKDDDFGRTLFGKPMDVAPYYASPRVPTVHHTMGGLEIDLECHVLDQDNNIIPGLYAAGEVTGGIHGANRLGGNALVDIHVFGRIAGRTAAEEL